MFGIYWAAASPIGLSCIQPVMYMYTALWGHTPPPHGNKSQWATAARTSPRPSIVGCLDTRILSESMPDGSNVASHMFLSHINHEAATLHCIPIPLRISVLDLTDNTPQWIRVYTRSYMSAMQCSFQAGFQCVRLHQLRDATCQEWIPRWK
jgi:hypothetical protein